MLHNIPKSPEAFAQTYKGKTLAIKVSGAEMEGNSFEKLQDAIQEFTRDGIRVVLMFGGGNQISTHWNAAHRKQRPKIDGMGVTSEEVLNDAVLPAYRELSQKIFDAFPDMSMVTPGQVECTRHPNEALGYVGSVKHIRNLSKGGSAAIGFMGSDAQSGQLYNVNGDDLLEAFVRQQNNLLNGVMLLTGSGGVLNEHGEKIPVIFGDQLRDDGTHVKHEITGGMKKKCEVIKQILPHVHKAVVTNVDGLRDEIFNVFGSGTLFADRESLQLSPVEAGSPEEDIFDDVVMAMRKGENPPWKRRSHLEMSIIRKNHQFLSVKNSPLGGMSLTNQPGEATLLEAVWAGYLGGGVSRELVQRAKQLHSSLVTRTRSDAFMNVLKTEGFTYRGIPEGQQSTEWTWQQ